ncbi:MAG: hypothetical protein QXR96_01055 [Candidatus Woesearchaeota archaeon]
MAYDSSLDKVLFSENFESANSRITVSVYSYNNANPKLQISRENNENGEWKFTKLGRLTKEEAEKIMPLMEKALSYM